MVPARAADRVAGLSNPKMQAGRGIDGMDFFVGKRAMEKAVVMAKESNLGMAGMRRSTRRGMAALYLLQAALPLPTPIRLSAGKPTRGALRSTGTDATVSSVLHRQTDMDKKSDRRPREALRKTFSSP